MCSISICHDLRIGIELDGGQHYEHHEQRRDAHRARLLKSAGVKIIRFTNLEVLNDLESVWAALELEALTPTLSQRERG